MILKAVYLFGLIATIIHQTKSAPGTKADDIFHNSNGVFSIYLFSNVSATNKGSMLVNPVSLNYALTAVSLGAAGNSLTQLRTILNQPNDNDTIIYSYRSFTEKENKNGTLNLVTQLYIDKQFQVRDKFNNSLTHGFKAKVQNVDFANDPDGSRQIINSYVDKDTDHIIKELFQPGSITDKINFLVVNAVYIKSPWQNPFSESDTMKRPFYVADYQYQVDMMFKGGESYIYAYNKEINAQIIEIPYLDAYSLLVILPKDKDGIADVENRIKSKVVSSSSSPFIDIFADATWEEVDVFLPKFKFQQIFQLKGTLQAMGLKDVFNDKANFEYLSPTKVQMSDVIHQTYFSVDEAGTLAGTAAGAASKPPFQSRTVFNADHPFFYVIKLGDAKTPLFIGKYMKP